jgi:hypothetical protein
VGWFNLGAATGKPLANDHLATASFPHWIDFGLCNVLFNASKSGRRLAVRFGGRLIFTMKNNWEYDGGKPILGGFNQRSCLAFFRLIIHLTILTQHDHRLRGTCLPTAISARSNASSKSAS